MSMKINNRDWAAATASISALKSKTTQKRALERALVKAAQPIADLAAAYAPIDDGDLESAIGVGTKLSERGRKASPPPADAKYRVNVYVGVSDDAPAAPLVEFGTAERVKKSTGQDVGHVTPDPFLRPAWQAEGENTLDRLADLIKIEIDKAIGRQSRRASR